MSSVMIGISADADADRTLLDDQPVCAESARMLMQQFVKAKSKAQSLVSSRIGLLGITSLIGYRLDDQPVCSQCHQSDAAYAIL